MHSLAKIKTVCTLTLHTGVQRQYFTAQRYGFFFKPVEYPLASALRAMRIITYKIVDIQSTPFVGIFNQAPYCKRQYRAIINGHRHARSVGEHRGQTRYIIFRKLRSQLPMHNFRLNQPARLSQPTGVIGNGNNAHLTCHAVCDSPQESARCAQSPHADRLRAAEKPDGSDRDRAS